MNPLSSFYSKEGLVEVELSVHKKTGLYFRPNSSDLKTIKESIIKDYSTIDCKDHIVLDLGSNIGGFIYKAINEGADKVLGYEPEPNNFKVLSLNTNHIRNKFNITEDDKLIINEAAVSDKVGEFELVINPGKNSACSASLTSRTQSNRKTVLVKVDNFFNIIEEYKPSLIKMDIEGAEYPLLKDDLPFYVKEMAIELHGFSKNNNKLMFETLENLKKKWNIVNINEQIVFKKLNLIQVHLRR